MADYSGSNMIQGGYDDTEEVEALKSQIKGGAEGVAKKAGTKVAKGAGALLSRVVSALGTAIASNPIAAVVVIAVIVLFVIIIIVAALIKAPVRDYYLAVKDKLTLKVDISPTEYLNVEKFRNWAEYDDVEYDEHLEGESSFSHYNGDPDHTDQVLTGLNKAISGDEEAEERFWYILSDQNLWHSQEDALEVLTTCSLKNMLMFEESKVRYEYHTWTDELVPFDSDGDGADDSSHYEWVEDLTETTVMTDPWYGDEARLDIEGEEDSKGLHRFQMHWPEILSYIEIASWGQYEYWSGKKEDYDPGRLFKPADNVSGYYLLYDELKEIIDMFEYKFKYKWDSIEDGKDNLYKYEGLEKGEYTIGYHFKKEEPDSILETTVPDYSWDTRYVPEAAPDRIYNGWETVQYVYTDISNVPNYLPAGDTYKPPEGIYCAGRWTTTDPRSFIDTMSEYCQYYRASYSDDYDWLDLHGYEYDEEIRDYNVSLMSETWSDLMIDHFIEWLEDLPYSKAAGRPELFRMLADDYREGVIRVKFEGTKLYPEFEEDLNTIFARYYGCTVVFPLAEGAEDDGLYPEGWTTDIENADLGLEEWLEVPQDDLSGMPFHSYGVTFHSADGEMPEDPEDPEPYKPQPNKMGGRLWISRTVSGQEPPRYYVDYWIDLYAGAEADLCVNDNLSAAQIKQMLADGWGGYKVDTMDVANALKQVQDDENISISAMLAIMFTERGGAAIEYKQFGEHNNFFDIKAKSGEPSFGDGWKSFKDMSVAEAMDEQVRDVARRYLKRGQNTFYLMTFKGYGYPQNWDQALAAQPNITHSYCPWWQDEYIHWATGAPSHPETPTYSDTAWTYLWCNQCAKNRNHFLALVGAGGD